MKKAMIVLMLLVPSVIMAQMVTSYDLSTAGICSFLESLCKEMSVRKEARWRVDWELHPDSCITGLHDFEATYVSSAGKDLSAPEFWAVCIADVGCVTQKTSWDSRWLYMNMGDSRYRISTQNCRKLVYLRQSVTCTETEFDLMMQSFVKKLR